ncbi:hypothetical protein P7F88_09725 [Vibrio hannami]|uniref:hypothetical protein n=1 Tax=Vibrio hannami TaxID=2717094 RepID=UPI00240F6B58|nr:hypothetical protein [Vibrio hannami]MDG3086370.1 hypothetical protein [Vibrio hannami]
MKLDIRAKLVPVTFSETNDREKLEFDEQMLRLKEMYGKEAEFLDPIVVGEELPKEADAIVFPQLIFAAFRHQEELSKYDLPMVVLTSKFGTVEMWDWEIVSYLRARGMNVFSPYNVELGKVVLRSIGVKSHLNQGAKFLMFQDDPGEGMQPGIFKRFYWWEQECTERMEEATGVQIIYRSWKAVNERAAEISDEEALALWESWDVENEGLNQHQQLLPAKLYIAIKEVIYEVGDVEGIGANCLNESASCATTPCLVWNMLFEKEDIIWCCEGDTLTMLSTYIMYRSLYEPIMMTNIYPFLVGMAAIAHEKMDAFPDVPEPDNCALGVHCGYGGLANRSFCSKWKMVPKVLEIVDDNAYMIDCELPVGEITLAKIHQDFNEIAIIPANIDEYLQFPGTDARNASLIRYKDGEKVMDELSSHHQMIIVGNQKAKLQQMARVFNWNAKVID